MNDKRLSAVDMLYEEPGPRTRRITRIVTVLSVLALVYVLYRVIHLFYINGQLEGRYWSFFIKWTTWRFLGKGILGTLEAAVAAGIITFGIGFVFMVCRISPYRVLRVVGTALVEFTRGVPTLLFIYFFFLVVPKSGFRMSGFWKISLPVAISASGVVAEVLRSGVNAVPGGQREAALSLGMRPSHVFLRVVFPQGFRYVIPALISELVIVVKDTTFAYVVNFPDLMQNAKVLVSNYDSMLPVYLVVAIIYILINYCLNRLSAYLANRRKGAQRVTVKTSQVV